MIKSIHNLRNMIAEIEEELPYLEKEEQEQLKHDLSRYREELRDMMRNQHRARL